MKNNKLKNQFKRLYEILKYLRSENGCDWDKAQTPQSIRKNLIEECYELIDAINNNDIANIREEAGDVYLVITMLSIMYEDQGNFTVSDVLSDIGDKLIRRHPHVFAAEKSNNAEESSAIWKKQKTIEGHKEETLLSRVGRGLPPLERGQDIDKKLTKVGFYFENIEENIEKIEEELAELKAEIKSNNKEKMIDELGDVLLSTTMLANQLNIDASDALNHANNKVVNRFNYIEKKMKDQNIEIKRENVTIMEKLWQESKINDKNCK